MASPYTSQSSLSAIEFAKACIESGHEIYRVFFYHDGANSGSILQTPQQDEINIQKSWQELAIQHDIDLVICIAAALKRGQLDETEATRYEKSSFNIEKPFVLSGLGQLVDAQLNSNQVVTFG